MKNMQERVGATCALIELLRNSNNKIVAGFSGATLAYVKEVTRTFADGYGTVSLIPVPQWDADGINLIEGYFFSDMALTEGKLVLTVFTDRDFRPVIDAQVNQTMATENQNAHSKNFGVVINL